MKIEELKLILKPLIKKCIKEVVFEEGVLRQIIKEVLNSDISAQKNEKGITSQNQSFEKKSIKKVNNSFEKEKKKLLESIGKEAYNGVNIFENINSTIPEETNSFSNIDPKDPGLDITDLTEMMKEKWNVLSKGKK